MHRADPRLGQGTHLRCIRSSPSAVLSNRCAPRGNDDSESATRAACTAHSIPTDVRSCNGERPCKRDQIAHSSFARRSMSASDRECHTQNAPEVGCVPFSFFYKRTSPKKKTMNDDRPVIVRTSASAQDFWSRLRADEAISPNGKVIPSRPVPSGESGLGHSLLANRALTPFALRHY